MTKNIQLFLWHFLAVTWIGEKSSAGLNGPPQEEMFASDHLNMPVVYDDAFRNSVLVKSDFVSLSMLARKASQYFRNHALSSVLWHPF